MSEMLIRHCNGMWKPWKMEGLPFSFLDRQCFLVYLRFHALVFPSLVLVALLVCGSIRTPR